MGLLETSSSFFEAILGRSPKRDDVLQSTGGICASVCLSDWPFHVQLATLDGLIGGCMHRFPFRVAVQLTSKLPLQWRSLGQENHQCCIASWQFITAFARHHKGYSWRLVSEADFGLWKGGSCVCKAGLAVGYWLQLQLFWNWSRFPGGSSLPDCFLNQWLRSWNCCCCNKNINKVIWLLQNNTST